MEDYRDEYILVHHGVKGMKWGVRRAKIKSGSLKKKRADKQLDDGDEVVRRSKKGRRVALGIIGGAIGATTIAAIGLSRVNKGMSEVVKTTRDAFGDYDPDESLFKMYLHS